MRLSLLRKLLMLAGEYFSRRIVLLTDGESIYEIVDVDADDKNDFIYIRIARQR